MERLFAAVANRSQLAIVRQLLDDERALTPRELRVALGVPSKDRAHFGRQVTLLHHVGVLERDRADPDRFVVAESELVEQFLQRAADLEAALDARRAARSRADAGALRKASMRRATRRIPPLADG